MKTSPSARFLFVFLYTFNCNQYPVSQERHRFLVNSTGAVIASLVLLFLLGCTTPPIQQPNVSGNRTPSLSYVELPLSFEANRGQTDTRVQFLARGRGYNIFLTPNETVFA